VSANTIFGAIGAGGIFDQHFTCFTIETRVTIALTSTAETIAITVVATLL
jgi:hypothetical protein